MSEPKDCTGFLEAAVDLDAVIQSLLREVYEESTEDLRDYANKLRFTNQRKKAVREYVAALRDLRFAVISTARQRKVNIFQPAEPDQAVLVELVTELSTIYKVDNVAYELGIPAQVPPQDVKTPEDLDAAIKQWEEELQSIGEDAQLANVDMQNMMQKQQQSLQLMSGISKMLHDTAMDVIRKIG